MRLRSLFRFRAPWWAVELRNLILTLGEKIMSDVTALNASIDALKAEVGDIGTRMDKLFADLRELDDLGVDLIWVETPPDDQLWAGVRDRLSRAAAA